jgi:predicted PurR-regulated permease PerM
MDTQIQNRAFLFLLALVTIAFIWIMLPFYGAVLWAVILAILFRPANVRLARRLGGRRNLAAGLTVLAVILIAILPAVLIVAVLVEQGAAFVARVQAGEIGPPGTLDAVLDRLPGWVREALDGIGITDFASLQARLAEAVAGVSQFLATQALNVGQNTLRLVAGAGVMLYLLFFLLRDGPQIGAAVRSALPLGPEVIDALIARFASVARATVKGNLIIALVQGTIGGVTFWLLGIQGALLWGAIMMFLSLLPAVGAALVWAPVAAYLILTGDVVKGVILIAIGAGVIGLIDNLLRPPLVGRGTRLPDYMVLISTLGGLVVLGINGFVLGPLIAALFVASWTLYRDARHADEAFGT